ncbi:transcriptional regulator, PaaX family [Actinomadura meyerae]|jgi:phenylacetic acid degradation operon negative regulatory protein|uniref:Transcriptional regulator, PaaX family n=1 Tax=Actinomadura meyerae TaxID=240840 RepID=A0A239LWV8_9ACTN|nr:PaaX family transcriptional regulator C-terminal domain-containing protein [Actinomadura meyerae]SNT34770.1 transcriptional regulator, PaaX family [Actinomadura meyerae]
MTAEQDEASASARPRRRAPQQLLFSFLGSLVLDRGLPPISSRVFLHLLEDLGVAEAAGRATLARMTRKGLLVRVREGRTARFSLTPWAEELLREATPRVRSPEPFAHPGGEWTLLSYSMPESRRDLRHQIRARLIWAGFGGLRDGLWIAPGRVDIDAIFAGPEFAGLAELADAFYSVPVEGTDVPRLLRRAWDVEAIRAEHESFIATWTPDQERRGSPLSRLTLLGADWLQLLRTDPGLPAGHLPADWPAPASTALYRERFAALEPDAADQLRTLLAADAGRR